MSTGLSLCDGNHLDELWNQHPLVQGIRKQMAILGLVNKWPEFSTHWRPFYSQEAVSRVLGSWVFWLQIQVEGCDLKLIWTSVDRCWGGECQSVCVVWTAPSDIKAQTKALTRFIWSSFPLKSGEIPLHWAPLMPLNVLRHTSSCWPLTRSFLFSECELQVSSSDRTKIRRLQHTSKCPWKNTVL